MSSSIDLNRTSGLVSLGTHSFQVTERSWEEEGPSGDTCWYIICKVISPGDDQGKELLHTLSHGYKSRWKMDEFLDGIGAPARGKWTLEQCVGKKFRGSVSHDSYNGKPKSVLDNIIPASELQMSFETPSEASQPDAALPKDVLLEEPSEVEEQSTGRRRF